ncbi:hypothetical protein LSTR_LSTR016955, partial [Laodelphax striatellus]
VPGDLVPAEVSDHNAARAHNNRSDLAGGSHDHAPLGAVLRRGHLQRGARRAHVRGGVARLPERQHLLPVRQPHHVLHCANDTHIALLHTHLDQSVQTPHTQRHQGRADGAHAAEEQ